MDYRSNEIEVEVYSRNRTERPDDGVALKKGPWTSDEDAILVEYVKKHGERNWNAVRKYAGLSRCGKSCRLRWANHLRPDLKKGPFTREEERLIIELHGKMGNKWARIAAHLPGRTDNEIKNYWNTRIKRLEQAGFPLYPPELCLQALQEHRRGQKHVQVDIGNKGCHGILQTNHYGASDILFDYLKGNQFVLPQLLELPDVSSSCMPSVGPGYSQNFCFTPPTVRCQKRLRHSSPRYPDFNSTAGNGVILYGPLQENSSKRIAPSIEFDSSPDLGLLTGNLPAFSSTQGSHSLSTGNSSDSKPASVAMKLELPSFQYPETGTISGTGSSQLPPLPDLVDAYTQSTPQTGAFESDSVSPRNSGLLDALLYEAKTLSAKSNSPDKSLKLSTVTSCDLGDSSTKNVCESELEEYGNLVSPLGCSAASLLNEYCRASSHGSMVDEQLSAETFSGYNKELKPDNAWNGDQHEGARFNLTLLDDLFASDLLEQNLGSGFAAGLCDDLVGDYNSFTANQEWQYGSS